MEPITIIQDRKELQSQKRIRKVLLICGILSSLQYVATDIIGGMLWNGYSFTHQAISELAAMGSPVGPLLGSLFIIYPGFGDACFSHIYKKLYDIPNPCP